METKKIKKNQSDRKKESPDERRSTDMLELYTIVPPSPYVLKKRKKKRS